MVDAQAGVNRAEAVLVCLFVCFPLDARMLAGILEERNEKQNITDLPRNKHERENRSKHVW